MCSALTNITLPDFLEDIDRFACIRCTSIERVDFNKNLKTIGANAFLPCSSLANVVLSDKLEVIE